MFDVLLSIAASFALTFLAIPVIITVADKKKLYDVPDARKVHQNPIPSLGGLGIYCGFMLACLTCMPFKSYSEMQFVLAASFVIFFLGLKDDILVLSPIKKFIGQIFAAFLIVYKGGIQIESMQGVLGVYNLNETASLVFTYLTIIVIVNSFNLIDGIDGLAGTLGLMTSLLFAIYFQQAGYMVDAILGYSLAGASAAFLIFNFQPAKIFMGDTGSLLIGLISAVLVIRFINLAGNPAGPLPIEAAPAIGFIVLMVPLMDTLRVFTIRIFNRRSPFSADRNHIHHLLLDRGFSHRAITCTLVGANLAIIIAAYLLRELGANVLILGTGLLFFSIIFWLYYNRPKARTIIARRRFQSIPQEESKSILPFIKDNSILEQKN